MPPGIVPNEKPSGLMFRNLKQVLFRDLLFTELIVSNCYSSQNLAEQKEKELQYLWHVWHPLSFTFHVPMYQFLAKILIQQYLNIQRSVTLINYVTK